MNGEEFDEQERQAAKARLKRAALIGGGILAIIAFIVIVISTEFIPKYRANQKLQSYEDTIKAVNSHQVWFSGDTTTEERIFVGMNLFEAAMSEKYKRPEKDSLQAAYIAVKNGKADIVVCVATETKRNPSGEETPQFDLISRYALDQKTNDYYKGKLIIDGFSGAEMEVLLHLDPNKVHARRSLKSMPVENLHGEFFAWLQNFQNKANPSTPTPPASASVPAAPRAVTVDPEPIDDRPPAPQSVPKPAAPPAFGRNEAVNFAVRYYLLGNSEDGDAVRNLQMISKDEKVWYYDKYMDWADIRRESMEWDRTHPYRRYGLNNRPVNCVEYSDGFYISLGFWAETGTSPDSAKRTFRKGYLQIKPKGNEHYITRITSCGEDEDAPFPGWVIAKYRTKFSDKDMQRKNGTPFKDVPMPDAGALFREIMLQDRVNFYNGRRDSLDEECGWLKPEAASNISKMVTLRRTQLEPLPVYLTQPHENMLSGRAVVEVEVKLKDRVTFRFVENESDRE